MRIPFGEWLPDQNEWDNPGLSVAENVLPTASGYRELPTTSDFTSAMGSNPVPTGLFNAINIGGDSAIYAGTTGALWELQSDQTWVDVSKSGGYSLANRWDWCQWGDWIIAASGSSNEVQYFDLSSSSVFADLAGSPPNASCCANVRDFIVLGDLPTAGSSVKWSAYNDPTTWTPSRATQSDVRVLDNEFGRVERIVGGQQGIIFQKFAIWTMDYVGPPVIFNFSLVSKHGTPAPASVCYDNDKIFYLSNDGFYQYPNIPIGHEKVNRWFFDTVAEGRIEDVVGAVDKRNSLVCWAFTDNPSAGSSLFSHLLFYHWPTGRWSYADASAMAGGSDIRWVGNAEPTGNIITESERLEFVVFDAFERLCSIDSSTITAAKFETGVIGFDKRMAVNVRPLVANAGTDVTVARSYISDEDDAHSFGTAKGTNARGVVNFRDPERFSKFQVNITGGFDEAHGIDIEPIEKGLR